MSIVETLKQKIYEGGQISREEAIALSHASLKELTKAADEIRKKYVRTLLTCVPLSMENAAAARKTANTAPRAPITMHPVLRAIRFCPQRNS